MASVPTRQLGKGGPMVPRMGFGAMGLSFSYGVPLPDEQRLALLDRAHEIGETFWDSSDIYGDSEDLLGKWFSSRPGKRQDIFLATKFGGIYAGPNQWSFRGDAAYVREACDKSLKRFGVDYIDLYYPHRLDGSTPVEHIVAEMVKLKEQGKIRHLGLCEVSAATLRRAHAVHPIAAVQVEYSPFSTDIEDPAVGLLAACRELGVAVVAYSPLSRGLLSGRVPEAARGVPPPTNNSSSSSSTGNTAAEQPRLRLVSLDEQKGALQGHEAAAAAAAGDVRRFYPRFAHDNLPHNLAVVAELQRIAEDEVVCTAAQLALAWLLYQGDDIFPIPGTSKIKYLEENFAAANIELTPDQAARIRARVQNAAAGGKWPESMGVALFADTPLP